jgi:hypothetical protein
VLVVRYFKAIWGTVSLRRKTDFLNNLEYRTALYPWDYYNPVKFKKQESLTSLPFDDNIARSYDKIYTELSSKGTSKCPNDLMITSIGLAKDGVPVRDNVSLIILRAELYPGLFEQYERGLANEAVL